MALENYLKHFTIILSYVHQLKPVKSSKTQSSIPVDYSSPVSGDIETYIHKEEPNNRNEYIIGQ